MIRFLILCTIFFLLYLGFNTINGFDSEINISFLDYQIQTTVFTFLALFLMFQLVLMIVLKTVFLIFDLPFIISRNWHKKKLKRMNDHLLRIISELLMGNKQRSIELAKKIIIDFDENNKDIENLILAESESSFDMQIQRFRELVDKKNYSIYSAKKLAQIFFDNAFYIESEEYATKAFNENDTDAELMIMLIRIYAKNSSWKKMIFLVSKLQRAEMSLLVNHSEEISHYYYLAAKSSIAKGSDNEAIKFLESSLELKPDHLESLNLFTGLSVNMNNSSSILKLLKSAFISCPCFEIALMYIKCSKSSVNVIYGTLAGLVNPSENNALFLSIAAYLGLYDKIADIKEPKLINYDSKIK
jgi:tetratricopeptide (TPR) repeat protein